MKNKRERIYTFISDDVEISSSDNNDSEEDSE